MKTPLLALAMLLCTFAAKAQYVTIPDPAFALFLQQTYPNCMNGNQMDTTCSEITDAIDVFCPNRGIQDLDGIQYFDNVQTLDCRTNQITSLPDLPASLMFLECNSNGMTMLPQLLPPLLKGLDCSNNSIQVLPPLPTGLIDLYCRNNQLLSLPTLPITLARLECHSNPDIQVLPTLPPSLEQLYADATGISSLPDLPEGLFFLSVRNTDISIFPTLPGSLKYFDLSYSPNAIMPLLPDGLLELSYDYTNITNVNSFPASLTSIRCEGNGIATLPQLPTSLVTLYCRTNLLTYLPALPNLKILDCSGNNIMQLGPLKDTMSYVDISNNVNLYCMPKFKHIQTQLIFTNTPIACLPNYFTVLQSNPPINSIPLCDQQTNVNNCIVYASISGRTYTDSNSNCVFDNTDAGRFGIKHTLFNNGTLVKQAYSNDGGFYSFDEIGLGNYETRLDTTGFPFNIICPTGGVYYDTLTANDSTHIDRDFALRCKTGFDLVVHSVASSMAFRPANNTVVDIHAGDLANFYSASCAQGVAGTVTVKLHGPISYIAPATNSITPSNVTNNVLTWNVADFGTADALRDFNIIVQTDTFAQSGQQACFEVNVTPLAGDNDTSNNHLYYCFNIVNSYDPNDKTAYPAGNIDTTQEWLTYTVRFQNTGTAEAQHIYIMDTLDVNVKAETFQLLSYSHQPNLQINENIVRFNFPFINLPDSNTNEPGSHGYVQYKVKLREDLPLGTAINNTAYIYFDFNPPVVTNTATNTIVLEEDTVGVGINFIPRDFGIALYPNPANNQVTVTSSVLCRSIVIYDIVGSIRLTQNVSGTSATIDISNLPSGLYIVGTGSSNKRMRLVKQ